MHINEGISCITKKLISKLEIELLDPKNNNIKIKLYHDKQVDFTVCKHLFDFNEVCIPCQQIINAPKCYYNVPSIHATLAIPMTRIFKRYSNKFDFKYINPNSVNKMCEAQTLEFFINDS